MIILNKRVMAPRNILNNIVEGNVELLKKAREFFTLACRPTVGYKQLSRYLGVTIVVVEAETVKIEEQVPAPVVNKYIAEATAFKELFIMKTKPKVEEKPVPVLTPAPVDVFADFSQECTQSEEPITKAASRMVFDFEDTSPVSFNQFVQEITNGILLKPTRRDDEVDIVVKAVWRRFKDRVENKEACKQFCIEVHKAFTATMNELPPHWFFVQSNNFIKGYFQTAINYCRPQVMVG